MRSRPVRDEPTPQTGEASRAYLLGRPVLGPAQPALHAVPCAVRQVLRKRIFGHDVRDGRCAVATGCPLFEASDRAVTAPGKELPGQRTTGRQKGDALPICADY